MAEKMKMTAEEWVQAIGQHWIYAEKVDSLARALFVQPTEYASVELAIDDAFRLAEKFQEESERRFALAAEKDAAAKLPPPEEK